MCLSHYLKVTLVLWLFQFTAATQAEVYFYLGPGGERMATDRPVPGYQLINRRDSLKNAGHILANRPISTGGPRKFQSDIQAASNRFGVDPALVEAVIQVESGFDPNAISTSGAAGLMQLMAATANQYSVNDRHNPRENINAGVEHLKKLMDRFDGDITLAVAAYNAGASAVERYEGIPPYPETRRYVSKVMNFHSQYRQLRYGAD
jgi:soluble lytic murein transglycosylase-like protein